jgi:hypothetical protein
METKLDVAKGEIGDHDKSQEKIRDPQTGQTFLRVPERWFDIVAAWVSIGYSLAAIVFLGWLFLDTWMGVNSAFFMKSYQPLLKGENSAVFKLVMYTAIGGGMGAAVNNIRSFVHWHAELKGFGWRFVWKYISMPPLGATLAVMVYAIIRGGIAVFSGGFSSSDGTITSFSAWATGALAGYGSHKVFIWLDDKVNTLFTVTKVTVPDVKGKTRDEAEQTLRATQLALGDVAEEPASDANMIGKVMRQTPSAGAEAAPDSKVSITIGAAPGEPPPGEPPPGEPPPGEPDVQ